MWGSLQNEYAGSFVKKILKMSKQIQQGSIKGFWRVRKGIVNRTVWVILTEKMKCEKDLKEMR